MNSYQESTLYDVLDLSPDATSEELRLAYLRAKATYHKDNVVLYSLVSTEEREFIMRRIEEAYTILSDPDRRRAYDQKHNLLQIDFISNENLFHRSEDDDSPFIDMEGKSGIIPPFDITGEDDLLIPPSTDVDFSSAEGNDPAGSTGQTLVSKISKQIQKQSHTPLETENPSFSSQTLPLSGTDSINLPTVTAIQTPIETRFSTSSSATISVTESSWVQKSSSPHKSSIYHSSRLAIDPALVTPIEMEKNWSGQFLKRIREAYRISLEEMSETTKISKSYLIAIEEENFSKLPAGVYTRGFVSQVARVLKLPQEKVASAYMERYNAIR